MFAHVTAEALVRTKPFLAARAVGAAVRGNVNGGHVAAAWSVRIPFIVNMLPAPGNYGGR